MNHSQPRPWPISSLVSPEKADWLWWGGGGHHCPIGGGACQRSFALFLFCFFFYQSEYAKKSGVTHSPSGTIFCTSILSPQFRLQFQYDRATPDTFQIFSVSDGNKKRTLACIRRALGAKSQARDILFHSPFIADSRVCNIIQCASSCTKIISLFTI